LDQLDSDYPEDFWQGSYYIADSALMTEPALTKIGALGMYWLGRLPATFGLCDQLIDQAWNREEPWVEVGTLAVKRRTTSASYRAQTFDTTLYGQPVRAFAYHSSALDKKKEHTLQRAIAREAQAVEKLAQKLAKQVFHCVEDATAASDQQVRTAKIRWHEVTPTIVEQVVIRRPRGRQKAGVEPTRITHYTVQWHWTAPTADRIQQARERQSTFILMTSDRTCDAVTALREYKAQDQDEHGFRWMKAPVHLAAFFLEKPERVVGLGYVLLLALQFARFMRAIVRDAMVSQPPLDLPDGRKIANPSERVILDALRTLWVERRAAGDVEWYQWTHVKPHVWRILETLRVPIEHRFQWDDSG
jgi:transposase